MAAVHLAFGDLIDVLNLCMEGLISSAGTDKHLKMIVLREMKVNLFCLVI